MIDLISLAANNYNNNIDNKLFFMVGWGYVKAGGLYNNIINSNYNENKLFSVSSFFKLRVLFTPRVGCPSVRLSGNASPAAALEARNESNSTIKGIFNQCQNRVN